MDGVLELEHDFNFQTRCDPRELGERPRNRCIARSPCIEKQTDASCGKSSGG